MCTISWLHEPDGHQLLCNRDEKHERLQALGPKVECREDLAFIAPIDRNYSGTWVAVNEYGVSLCLLNRAGSPPAQSINCGAIIINLAAAQS